MWEIDSQVLGLNGRLFALYRWAGKTKQGQASDYEPELDVDMS